VKFNPMVNEALTFLPKLSNKVWAPRGEIVRQRISGGWHTGCDTPLALRGDGCLPSCHPDLTAHLPLFWIRVTRPSGGMYHPSVELLLQVLYRETTMLPTLPSTF